MAFNSSLCKLLLISLILFSAITQHVATSIAINTTTNSKHAYVTLLYGNYYVLPVRVLMHSLLSNSPDVASGKTDRVVLVTGPTSNKTINQLKHDGIIVKRISSTNSPYTSHPKFHPRFSFVMTKLYVFRLTEYEKVVFIDADSIVLNDISSLFKCDGLCATFINPCYFNSGMMMISPNHHLFQQYQSKLPSLPSYDGGDQGFLNSYFPDFLNAPYFDPIKPTYNLSYSSSSFPIPLRRLPFSWHVDHSAFFPTFSFQFEKAPSCGSARIIEWLGPPFLKPWLWWTYALFDLSWKWHSYRSQLHDPYPVGVAGPTTGYLYIITSWISIIFLGFLFLRTNSLSRFFTYFLPSLSPLAKLPDFLAFYYAILLGIGIITTGVFTSFFLVPKLLPPYFALTVFFHLRVAINLIVYLCVGPLFCIKKNHTKNEKMKMNISRRTTRKIFIKTFVWSIIDAAYLIVWSGINWQIPFSGMWSKLFFTISIGVTQFGLIATLLTRVFMLWSKACDGHLVGPSL